MSGNFAIAMKYGRSVLITEQEYEYWINHVLPARCFLTSKPSPWTLDWPVDTLLDVPRKEELDAK